MSEVYLYDEIVSNKWRDWDDAEHGFTPSDLAEPLRDAAEGETVDIYVNSPGGVVFAAVAMTSEIKRARQRGVTVNAYVDGIAASAASFLIMACSNVYMYGGTMLMVHKPISFCWGNADDMLKCAEDLEAIQEGTCMPLYRAKLKGEEEDLKAMITNEKWMSAREASEVFDITVIDEEREVKQFRDDVFQKYGYKNVPEQLIRKNATAEAEQIKKETPKPVDYSDLENRIKKAGGRK